MDLLSYSFNIRQEFLYMVIFLCLQSFYLARTVLDDATLILPPAQYSIAREFASRDWYPQYCSTDIMGPSVRKFLCLIKVTKQSRTFTYNEENIWYIHVIGVVLNATRINQITG